MADIPEPVHVNESVVFRVRMNGKLVTMRISDVALQDHFGAGNDAASLVEAYRKNAEKINEAGKRWQAYNPTLDVLLATGDF